ncbi:uncharacterized protein LOC127832140 isoform X1 [Dreissena polymorpha]|uniref:C-type lectin domain-containing protein n=1 Tax=Dreissena polymorpha TaxID=45954 RepID=A0A9D4JUQ4_DREPO|nr:uncharacterized protein LOC127832140 isoform X1 [Dreissena polymorpha]XP_052213359.1 uncharacterized protein LOC127832140 isoform X1 [Dreissena polymorpha]XP_052213360.1 uncharacterized protein LOC127832140 isoform X1 [Dreissena polymorpha]KAH3823639.1 hypothetical protein DPMN_125450 [Dreissena polymorpha]
MSTVSKFRFALLRPKSKATNTGFLLAFIIGVLEADFISNPSSTWYDVYIKCRNSKQTMMNWRMWTDEKPVLKITNPVWLYGFEVRIPNENRYFKFDQLHSNMTAFVRCVNRTAFADIYKTLTFEEARKNCENRANGSHMELPLMNNNNIDTFSVSNDIIDTTLWIQAADVGKILNSEDLNVHCFVLNNHGELRKDNCTKSYSSVCVNATVHDTIQYSGQESKVPNYDPTSPSTTVTSSAGTSEFVTSLVTSETNGDVDLTTSAANKSFDLNNSTSDHKSHAKDKPVMAEKIHIALICVGVAVVTALVVAVICCCIIKRKLNKHRRPTLSDGYPKTADSVNVKDAQHYEVSDISVYATPSDAEMGGHRTARPRSSIIEGEYDTISNSKATYKSKRQVAMVKAYSHVAIVPANQRRETDSNMENAYDVSTLNKQTIATISHQDGIGHVYGHLEVT